jgi:hypothetical protein
MSDIEDIFLEGAGLLRKSPELLAIPALKYVIYGLLFFCFCAVAVLAIILGGLSGSPPYGLLFAFFALALIVLAAVGSVFHAALLGSVSDVLDGKLFSAESAIGWARLRWLNVFLISMNLNSLCLLSLLLFSPALALYLTGHGVSAVFAGTIAASIVVGALLSINFLLSPIYYITVMNGTGVIESAALSARFVKANLPAFLVLWTVTMAASALLNSAVSLFSGPPMLIPYAGIIIAALIGIPLMVLESAVIEALTAIWWLKLLSKDGADK